MSKDREYKQIVKLIVVLFVRACRSNITIERQVVNDKSYRAKSLYTKYNTYTYCREKIALLTH